VAKKAAKVQGTSFDKQRGEKTNLVGALEQRNNWLMDGYSPKYGHDDDDDNI